MPGIEFSQEAGLPQGREDSSSVAVKQPDKELAKSIIKNRKKV
jgi:hypothetical protein